MRGLHHLLAAVPLLMLGSNAHAACLSSVTPTDATTPMLKLLGAAPGASALNDPELVQLEVDKARLAMPCFDRPPTAPQLGTIAAAIAWSAALAEREAEADAWMALAQMLYPKPPWLNKVPTDLQERWRALAQPPSATIPLKTTSGVLHVDGTASGRRAADRPVAVELRHEQDWLQWSGFLLPGDEVPTWLGVSQAPAGPAAQLDAEAREALLLFEALLLENQLSSAREQLTGVLAVVNGIDQAWLTRATARVQAEWSLLTGDLARARAEQAKVGGAWDARELAWRARLEERLAVAERLASTAPGEARLVLLQGHMTAPGLWPEERDWLDQLDWRERAMAACEHGKVEDPRDAGPLREVMAAVDGRSKIYEQLRKPDYQGAAKLAEDRLALGLSETEKSWTAGAELAARKLGGERLSSEDRTVADAWLASQPCIELPTRRSASDGPTRRGLETERGHSTSETSSWSSVTGDRPDAPPPGSEAPHPPRGPWANGGEHVGGLVLSGGLSARGQEVSDDALRWREPALGLRAGWEQQLREPPLFDNQRYLRLAGVLSARLTTAPARLRSDQRTLDTSLDLDAFLGLGVRQSRGAVTIGPALHTWRAWETDDLGALVRAQAEAPFAPPTSCGAGVSSGEGCGWESIWLAPAGELHLRLTGDAHPLELRAAAGWGPSILPLAVEGAWLIPVGEQLWRAGLELRWQRGRIDADLSDLEVSASEVDVWKSRAGTLDSWGVTLNVGSEWRR